ncbi:MAG: M48 family metalloprotease [Pseudomonadota bacterium]|nr:M48 family metalloprotease [Pseudomonadota bacterium]
MFLIHACLTVGAVQANTVNNFNDYSLELQKELGREFTNHLHTQYDVVQDPEINQYIRSLGHKIAQHTDNTKSFRFYVINNPDINAFAGPNGVIGIHTGLIQSVTTEDELASVIAHEIAHVTQDHLYRRLILQSESTLPQIASMIAAILIGTQDTNAGMAALLSANALQIQQQLKYSRLHEYEADHAGISYLHKSGYNPHAMPDFFEKLASAYQHYGLSAPEILRTHPLTENRLAKAQERALSLAVNKNFQDNTSLQLIQERVNKLYTPKASTNPINNVEAVTCYRESLKQVSDQKEPLNMGSCLSGLVKNNPQQFLYHALLLERLTKENNTKDTSNTKKSHAFSVELFPTNESIVIRYALLLVSENRDKAAIALLEESIQRLEYKHSIYTLLSKLYKNQNNTAYSYLNLALAQYEIGNIKRAAIHIQKAKTSIGEKNSPIKIRIEHMEEKLSKLLKEDAKE